MPQTSISNVLSTRYDYVKGKEAWRANLRLTASAAERIKSSLGPNGTYKLVTYHRGPEKIVKITRDAVTVLDEIAIQYPTLVVLSEAAKIQRQEAGDGVASFVILTAALLKKADELIAKGVHPNKVVRGYLEAEKKSLEIIAATQKELVGNIKEQIMETVDCGRNCLTAELRRSIIEASEIATDNDRFDKDKIAIIRKPGASLLETKLIKGIVIKKTKLHPNMPDAITKPRIAITSERIGTNRVEVEMGGQGPFHMEFKIEDPEQLPEYLQAEKQNKLVALKKLGDLGVTAFFSQQPIDDFSKSKLLEMGILAFESVDRSDLALISKSTGTNIVGNIAKLTKIDIGGADSLETEKVNLEKIVILGCNSNYATFFIRGSSTQVLDEIEQLIRNSLNLIQVAAKSSGTVPGAGATEIQIARQLKNYALQFSGREQLAISGFADALMEIPRCLAINNGVNAEDTLLRLGKLHSESFLDYGVASDGSCEAVCVDLSEVKRSVIRRAFEVASLMLRIDEQIVAKEIPKFHK